MIYTNTDQIINPTRRQHDIHNIVNLDFHIQLDSSIMWPWRQFVDNSIRPTLGLWHKVRQRNWILFQSVLVYCTYDTKLYSIINCTITRRSDDCSFQWSSIVLIYFLLHVIVWFTVFDSLTWFIIIISMTKWQLLECRSTTNKPGSV